MVKLRFRVVTSKYKGNLYRHEECTVTFGKDLHEILRFLANRQVKITAKREGNAVYFTMTEKQPR